MNDALIDIIKTLNKQTEIFKQIALELKALNVELRKDR